MTGIALLLIVLVFMVIRHHKLTLEAFEEIEKDLAECLAGISTTPPPCPDCGRPMTRREPWTCANCGEEMDV